MSWDLGEKNISFPFNLFPLSCFRYFFLSDFSASDFPMSLPKSFPMLFPAPFPVPVTFFAAVSTNSSPFSIPYIALSYFSHPAIVRTRLHINKQAHIFLMFISPLSGRNESIFVHAEHSDIKVCLIEYLDNLEY